MIRPAKRAIHRALNAVGYEISRPAFGVHENAFDAQEHILGALDVTVVIDAGANEGQTSLQYARRFPAATIHAFEPFSKSFAILEVAARRQPRIVPHQEAVGDREGSRRLHLNARASTNSFFETSAAAREYVDARLMETVDVEEVPVTTLDVFCDRNHVQHVDVLKLDVQGSELLALRGATGLLSEHRVDVVYSETLFASLYEGQAGFCDLHAELSRHGYGLYGIFDLNYGTNGLLAWADGLWVSPSVGRTGKAAGRRR